MQYFKGKICEFIKDFDINTFCVPRKLNVSIVYKISAQYLYEPNENL